MLELGQRTTEALSRALCRPVPSRDYRFALLFRAVKPTSSTLQQDREQAMGAADGEGRSLPVRRKRGRPRKGALDDFSE